MKTSDILKQAKALIELPSRWTRYTLARDASGSVVWPHDLEACKFCSVGAVKRAIHLNRQDPDLPKMPHATAIDALTKGRWLGARHTRTESLQAFNDMHTHPEVMKLFDDAIKDALQSEAQQEQTQ